MLTRRRAELGRAVGEHESDVADAPVRRPEKLRALDRGDVPERVDGLRRQRDEVRVGDGGSERRDARRGAARDAHGRAACGRGRGKVGDLRLGTNREYGPALSGRVRDRHVDLVVLRGVPTP